MLGSEGLVHLSRFAVVCVSILGLRCLHLCQFRGVCVCVHMLASECCAPVFVVRSVCAHLA